MSVNDEIKSFRVKRKKIEKLSFMDNLLFKEKNDDTQYEEYKFFELFLYIHE